MFPSIIMMIFTSIYSVVDGLFVSNFVGKSAFAAVNLIMPFLMGISALGFMIGTGGSAIVAKTLGEGKIENANEYFSMLVYITAIGGIIIAILSMFLVKPVAILFGASGTLLDNCILYGRILCISLPAFMLQNVFQSFFVTAEKPHLGLRVIVIAGVTNMVLDFLFVAVLHLGLPGAGFATVCGEFIGGLFPLFYFGRKNSSLLKLGKTHFHGRILLKTCTKGSSPAAPTGKEAELLAAINKVWKEKYDATAVVHEQLTLNQDAVGAIRCYGRVFEEVNETPHKLTSSDFGIVLGESGGLAEKLKKYGGEDSLAGAAGISEPSTEKVVALEDEYSCEDAAVRTFVAKLLKTSNSTKAEFISIYLPVVQGKTYMTAIVFLNNKP